MFWNGRTAIEGLSGSASRIERCSGVAGSACGAGFVGAQGGSDIYEIGPDRFRDVFEFGRAEVTDGKIEPRLHLSICIFGETNGSGLGDTFQSSGDVDAIAH